MPKRLSLPLSPSVSLILLSVIAVLLPLLPRLPLWLSVMCVCLIVWRLLHDLGRLSLPGRFLRLLVILFALAGLLFSYYTLFGRTAGSAFLALLLCMKLLEMHTRRDRMVVIFLACFMVVIGFLFSQSIFTGVYMLFEAMLLTTALISINHRPSTYVAQQTVYKDYFRLAGILLLQAAPLALVLFNVGVEIGQLIFISAFLLLSWLVARLRFNLADDWKKIPPYFIGSLASFWLIERTVGFWG